ncbi:hypothetical protein ACN4EG_21955 [Alkalinema pantanalense CENA528]|uniref:hypothetical protein n=1 Tax=Alkalinema pantanalense TaxID=1620705 RepID=UPI003D6FA925
MKKQLSSWLATFAEVDRSMYKSTTFALTLLASTLATSTALVSPALAVSDTQSQEVTDLQRCLTQSTAMRRQETNQPVQNLEVSIAPPSVLQCFFSQGTGLDDDIIQTKKARIRFELRVEPEGGQIRVNIPLF